jgi:hypothetical protein
LSSTPMWPTSLPGPDDDAAAWLDEELVRLDSTAVVNWRYRALRRDVASIMSARPRHRELSFEMPVSEFAVVSALARRRKLTATSYMRAATAYAVTADGVPDEAVPWLRKYGVWLPGGEWGG